MASAALMRSNNDTKSLIQCASFNTDDNVAESLVKCGIDINAQDIWEMSVLNKAINYNNNVDIAMLAINAGIDINHAM